MQHPNDDEVDSEPTKEDIEYKINNRYYEIQEEKKKLRNHAKRYSEKKISSWLKNIYRQRFMVLMRTHWYDGESKTVYQTQNPGM